MKKSEKNAPIKAQELGEEALQDVSGGTGFPPISIDTMQIKPCPYCKELISGSKGMANHLNTCLKNPANLENPANKKQKGK